MKKLLLIALVGCLLVQAGEFKNNNQSQQLQLLEDFFYLYRLMKGFNNQQLESWKQKDLQNLVKEVSCQEGSFIFTTADSKKYFLGGKIAYGLVKEDNSIRTIFVISLYSGNKSQDANFFNTLFQKREIKNIRFATSSERLKKACRMLLGSHDNEMSTKPVDFIVPGICLAAAAGACYYFNRK